MNSERAKVNGGLDPDFLLIGLDVLDNWSYHSQFFSTPTFQTLIEANDGTRLGFTYPDTANSLSIINEAGQYGSATSRTSIYNSSSSYGSSFGAQSAYNVYATTPPVIYRKNSATGLVTALAYLTKNTFKTPYEDPDELRVALLLAALPTTPQPPPKLSQAITFAQPANQMFSPNRTFALSATASSGLQVSFTSSNPNVLAISGNTATIKAAGSVTITARHGGNANYSPAPSVARTITVNKGAQTISFNQPVNLTFAPNKTFALVASNRAGLPVRLVSGNTNVVTIANNVATIRAAGSVVITATNSGNTNFNPGGLARAVTIGKAGQSIRPFATTNNVRFGTVLTFTNTKSSAGLPVTFQRVSGPVTITSNRAKVTGVGAVVIRAVQGGNSNYNPTVSLTNRFTTVKAGQTITFTNLPATATFRSNGLIPLAARSSSGLPVTYTSSRTNVLKIVGTNAVIKGWGTNMITARQLGNVVRTIIIR